VKLTAIVLLLGSAFIVFGAEDPTQLGSWNTGTYALIERSDWSRYDNGRYTGHVYREVRSSIVPTGTTVSAGTTAPTGTTTGYTAYRGNVFVLEETLRDMQTSARAVDEVISVRFQLYQNGTLKIENDQGFPALRGFPSYPAEAIHPGTKWTAQGERAVDPLSDGNAVIVPLVAEYEYRGQELYKNIPVYHIIARYASRYQSSGQDSAASFSRLQGSHEVDIMIRVADGLLLLMRDTLDETYTWPDGRTLRFRGFTLTFGEGTLPMNRGALITSLGTELGAAPQAATPVSVVPPTAPLTALTVAPPTAPPAAPLPATPVPIPQAVSTPQPALSDIIPVNAANIELSPVEEGIKLTIKDIRFVADSDQFLPEERERLNLIAEALKQVPDRTFLVEGHTAAVGRAEGEMTLSVERAKRMVDELISRGISADRFIYKGWGGLKPLADNATDAGRARNRRVEITILE
jgi:outer membrane protein OmpA-like peptidoglycan-associated protein